MPDRLWDATAWLDLAATYSERKGIPVQYAPKVAVLMFEVWRERDPDCNHWLEHCDLDRLVAVQEKLVEWFTFSENFPDLPRTELPNPVDELERELMEAS